MNVVRRVSCFWCENNQMIAEGSQLYEQSKIHEPFEEWPQKKIEKVNDRKIYIVLRRLLSCEKK